MARILLKLSGEALSGNKEQGIYSESVLAAMARAIALLIEGGNQVIVVIGGGNIVRGNTLSQTLRVARPTADYIGMLATIQNALVLRDYFNNHGLNVRVASSIAMPQICEGYIPQKISRHLEKGRAVILAAGLGVPYFTTDTAAVQRGLELSVDQVIFVKNGVDALYDADPKLVPTASRIRHTSASSIIEKNLRILDLSAIALAKEQNIILRIVGMGNIEQLTNTEFGTTISPE